MTFDHADGRVVRLPVRRLRVVPDRDPSPAGHMACGAVVDLDPRSPLPAATPIFKYRAPTGSRPDLVA